MTAENPETTEAPAAIEAPAATAAPETAGRPAPTSKSPFDPAGVPWVRVSPRLITVRLISLGVWFGVPLVGTVVLAAVVGAPGLWAVPAVIAALLVWIAILIPRQVHAIGYAERADDLLIRKGVMFRTLVVVPYGRMQFVDVQAGPLDRWGGIARVQLHTAAPASDAQIPGLAPAEADRLRDRLSALGEARLAGL